MNAQFALEPSLPWKPSSAVEAQSTVDSRSTVEANTTVEAHGFSRGNKARHQYGL